MSRQDWVGLAAETRRKTGLAAAIDPFYNNCPVWGFWMGEEGGGITLAPAAGGGLWFCLSFLFTQVMTYVTLRKGCYEFWFVSYTLF